MAHALRAALCRRMLLLNVDEAEVDTRTGNAAWKVLVYDAYGQAVLAPLFTVQDLSKLGVTLHL